MDMDFGPQNVPHRVRLGARPQPRALFLLFLFGTRLFGLFILLREGELLLRRGHRQLLLAQRDDLLPCQAEGHVRLDRKGISGLVRLGGQHRPVLRQDRQHGPEGADVQVHARDALAVESLGLVPGLGADLSSDVVPLYRLLLGAPFTAHQQDGAGIFGVTDVLLFAK